MFPRSKRENILPPACSAAASSCCVCIFHCVNFAAKCAQRWLMARGRSLEVNLAVFRPACAWSFRQIPRSMSRRTVEVEGMHGLNLWQLRRRLLLVAVAAAVIVAVSVSAALAATSGKAGVAATSDKKAACDTSAHDPGISSNQITVGETLPL